MDLFQAPVPTLPAELSLEGKTVIVTGATTAFEYVIAHRCVLLGAAQVILAVHHVPSGEKAKDLILQHPAINEQKLAANVKVMELNLGKYESVIAFADTVKKLNIDLNILLLNAGSPDYAPTKRHTTFDGHELVLQSNLLSNALLAFELFPLLTQTAKKTGKPGRLTWLGSFRQQWNTLVKEPIPANEPILEHFDDEKNYDSHVRYQNSKLLAAMFTSTLAKSVSPYEVIINTVCVGIVQKKAEGHIYREFEIDGDVVLGLRIHNRELADGARLYLYAAAVHGPETHGTMLVDNQRRGLPEGVRTEEGEEMKRKLWYEIMMECVKADGRIEESVTSLEESLWNQEGP
ncbi:hypothetical protein MMC30_003978 [Trapelia coarctata]|nr:hypothetical protein [Trapelia coarctata]